jgi:hypothetical protein
MSTPSVQDPVDPLPSPRARQLQAWLESRPVPFDNPHALALAFLLHARGEEVHEVLVGYPSPRTGVVWSIPVVEWEGLVWCENLPPVVTHEGLFDALRTRPQVRTFWSGPEPVPLEIQAGSLLPEDHRRQFEEAHPGSLLDDWLTAFEVALSRIELDVSMPESSPLVPAFRHTRRL